MTIVWDEVGSRVYETGLDRGVLYLPDGFAVPWNGLTSVIEKFDKSSSPVYFDGMKINDLVKLGSFSASMKAITYPDEFFELEGNAPLSAGIFAADQMPQTFGLCYRTKVGNDLNPDAGHKIHVLYNVTAIPSDRASETEGDDISLALFEWDITAIPQEAPGIRPSAHVIIDSTTIDPLLYAEIEEILYGTTAAMARLIPMTEFVTLVSTFFRVKIIDNGDGTWTAITRDDADLVFDLIDPEAFTLYSANVRTINPTTYSISDTLSILEL